MSLTLTIASHTSSQQGVMVRGIISFDGRTHLVVISGTVTAQLYDDDILQPGTLPFLLQHLELTFQYDNVRPYSAHVVINCLQACLIFPWSAWSLDISRIEHIWDFKRKRLRPSQNTDDLVQQLETIFREIL